MDDALAATLATQNKRLERVADELHQTNELLNEFLAQLEKAVTVSETKVEYPGRPR